MSEVPLKKSLLGRRLPRGLVRFVHSTPLPPLTAQPRRRERKRNGDRERERQKERDKKRKRERAKVTRPILFV